MRACVLVSCFSPSLSLSLSLSIACFLSDMWYLYLLISSPLPTSRSSLLSHLLCQVRCRGRVGGGTKSHKSSLPWT